MKYQKRAELVEAVQWFKNGDHPADGRERFTEGEFKGELFEGRIVRYYRRPDVKGDMLCPECRETFHNHGFIDLPFGEGQTVCPGDFIISTSDGKYIAMHPATFVRLYKKDHDHG